MSPANFDSIARPYRWLEYLSFGPILERCRFYRLPQLKEARRALVLGDGDGRFLARLLAANPLIETEVVDLSPAMLRLLTQRVEHGGAIDRVNLHCIDAQQFEPEGSYDLVVTHFLLDCFTTEELHTLTGRIRQHLAPGARWVVSEFAIPEGWVSFPARFVVSGLYAAFDLLTELGLTRLPDYASAFHNTGLERLDRRSWLGGLLVSEIWEVASLSS